MLLAKKVPLVLWCPAPSNSLSPAKGDRRMKAFFFKDMIKKQLTVFLLTFQWAELITWSCLGA